MILVCGLIDEPVVEHVLAWLVAHRREYLFLDERHLVDDVAVRLELAPDGTLGGELDYGAWSVRFDQISGVFNRLGMMTAATSRRLPARFRHRRRTLMSALDLLPVPVLNRPYPQESNSSKPAQYRAILDAGFRVPATSIGYTAGETRRHIAGYPHGAIIKSTSGVRSKANALAPERLAVVPAAARLDPNQVQARITGTNVRVHALGGQLFACEMVTTALDYRYAWTDGHEMVIRPLELPADVARACLDLGRRLQLDFTGIDLLRAEDGTWYCLEVNSAPGYTWFEEHSGLPITAALVAHLGGRGA